MFTTFNIKNKRRTWLNTNKQGDSSSCFPMYSEHSDGFRPNRTARDTVRKAKGSDFIIHLSKIPHKNMFSF